VIAIVVSLDENLIARCGKERMKVKNVSVAEKTGDLTQRVNR
jgi:hypothetical protein